MTKLGTFCVLAVLGLSSCMQRLPPHDTWEGILQLSERQLLPFRMTLELDPVAPTGHFIVGNEKIPIPEINRGEDSLVLGFSEYGAEMRATWDGRQLKGVYLRHRSGKTKSFPFTATPGASAASDKGSVNTQLPLGEYPVHFQGADESKVTVARFWKDESALYGTFIAPDGDYGLLEGKPDGTGIRLYRFTGWQAILIELKPDGTEWSGTFYAAGNEKPMPFKLGSRVKGGAEAAPLTQTSMKNPESSFEFACTATSGETVRNTDERFKGKALVVDIMGTWCHNCLDEAPVLQQLQEQFGPDGIEVVGLSFEITDDAELARKNLDLYRTRFGLTYTLLFCGSVDDANVEKRLKNQLHNFFAYPTTLFTDKAGRVRTVHSGFRGPGTGELFSSQVQMFKELAMQVVR
jgi:thiol-disulfide isomerase/thioredoxin